jgi:nitrate/nitrite transporter NarK
MVKSFGITEDDRRIADLSFHVCRIHYRRMWGRLSDKIGRKPVLITGLARTGLSMLIFSFALNLPFALLAVGSYGTRNIL